MDARHVRALEASRRRRGAAHPDHCPKLRCHGVDFAVPPRGVEICPRFDSAGRARTQYVGADPFPQIGALRDRLRRRARGRRLVVGGDLLGELMTLGRTLLVRQYDLSDDEIAGLLSFRAGQSPEWISGVIRWLGAAPSPRRPRRRRWFERLIP